MVLDVLSQFRLFWIVLVRFSLFLTLVSTNHMTYIRTGAEIRKLKVDWKRSASETGTKQRFSI